MKQSSGPHHEVNEDQVGKSGYPIRVSTSQARGFTPAMAELEQK